MHPVFPGGIITALIHSASTEPKTTRFIQGRIAQRKIYSHGNIIIIIDKKGHGCEWLLRREWNDQHQRANKLALTEQR